MQQSYATQSLHLVFLGLWKIVACSQPNLASELYFSGIAHVQEKSGRTKRKKKYVWEVLHGFLELYQVWREPIILQQWQLFAWRRCGLYKRSVTQQRIINVGVEKPGYVVDVEPVKLAMVQFHSRSRCF